jgi:hypothetical protein
VVNNQISSALSVVVGLALALGLAACNTPPPKQPGDDDNFGSSREKKMSDAPPSDTSAADTQPPPAPEKGGLNEDQRKQMEIALHRGGDKAAQCPVSTGIEDAPRGKGEVTVTFDGKKGRITDVTVGPPWAGTPIESCIKRSFVGEIVLPFDGEALEVPYTVEMPARKDAAPPPATGPKKKGK